MATILFPKINAALDPNERPQDQMLKPQGNNPTPAGPQQSAAPSGPNLSSGGSTEVSGGGAVAGNKAVQGQAPSQYTATGFRRIDALLQKNQGKQANVDLASGVQQSAQQGGQQLQNQANAYASKPIVEFGSAKDPSAVTQAKDGGAALDTVRTDLNAGVQRQSDFNYGGATSFDGINAFTSRDGATNALQKQAAGTNYSKGAARLDSLLLGTTQGYHDQANTSQQAVGGLRDNVAKTQSNLNGAGGVLDKQVSDAKAYQDNLRTQLTSQLGGFKTDNVNTIKGENAARAQMSERARAVRSEVEASMLKRPEFSQDSFAGATNRQALQRMFEDPSLAKFNTVGGDVSDYVDPVAAARFNRIAELVGNGDRMQAKGSLGGRGGFDEAGYRAEVQRLFGDASRNFAATPQPSEPGTPAGEPVPFSRIDAAIEAGKKAGRDIDPTSKDSYTNPVTGGWNTARDLTFAPAGKIVTAPIKSATAKAKEVPKNLGNEGVVGPRKEEPKKEESTFEKGANKVRGWLGV